MATAMGTGTRPPDLRGGGHPPGPPGFSITSSLNSGTPAWAGARSNRDRPYTQIISDSMSTSANIILKISLVSTDLDKKSINLQDSQLGDFLFNDLNLPVEDVLRLGFSTGRNDMKEILVKNSTDLSNITTDERSPPYHVYKDHKVSISTLDDKTTRVTFINVPLGVPDEELRHVCETYGKLTDGKIHTVTVKLDGQTKVTLPGSTKKVDVQLHQGKKMKNYYWLSGPGPNNSCRRVTVLHSNQGPRQCGHCLKNAAPTGTTDQDRSSFCQGGGNAKACKSINPERTSLSSYLNQLRTEGYSSLKDLHFQSQRANFPILGPSQLSQPGKMPQVDLPEREDEEDDEDEEEDDSQTSESSDVEKVQVLDGDTKHDNDTTEHDPESLTTNKDFTTSTSQTEREQTVISG